jgi:uncharacterized membrane protein
MATVIFLMFIAFIPFPTRLLADSIATQSAAANGSAEAAALAYGITMFLTAVMFNVLWRYAAQRNRLLRPDADARVIEGISRSYLLGPTSYGIATVIAVFSPRAGAALYGVIALFYVFESSVFGRRSS